MSRTAHIPNARFEYRDLAIPLSLRLEGARHPTRRELAAFHGWDGTVAQHLAVAAGEGWYPDEAADWDSLAAAGRFMTEVRPGAGAAEVVTVYKAVSIRLKRFARSGEAAVTETLP